jgi:hypothetical protein
VFNDAPSEHSIDGNIQITRNQLIPQNEQIALYSRKEEGHGKQDNESHESKSLKFHENKSFKFHFPQRIKYQTVADRLQTNKIGNPYPINNQT